MSDGAKTGTEDRIKQILTFINETPRVLSLLYDLGLLPEQLSRTSREWAIMCQLVDAELRMTEALKVAGEALAVAIVQLYDSHKEDCIKAFTLDQLQWASDTSEPLRDRTVEAIYLEALAALERIRKP